MILKQSSAYTRLFMMVLSSDHITGATGKSPAVELGKTGGTGVAAQNSPATEISSGNLPGWYQIGLTPTDLNTLGDLIIHCTAAACDATDFCDQVQAQVFTDLALVSGSLVTAGSPVRQNTAFNVMFPMTLAGTFNPAIGLGSGVAGQRNFGSGFSPVTGLITELGNGVYLFAAQPADTNSPSVIYRFSNVTCNDQDVTFYPTP